MVAIIILNWNGTEDTLNCLQSISNQDTEFLVTSIVIDNGSKISCKASLLRKFPEVEVIESKTNLGFTGGCNLGASHAKSLAPEFLFFLNNDATLLEGCLATLVTRMKQTPQLGMLNPMMLWNPNHKRSSNGPYLVESAGLQIDWHLGQARHHGSRSLDDYNFTTLITSDFCHGGALLIRTELFFEVGGFDESFFAYDEDVDLGVKTRARGFSCACYPVATVVHQIGASSHRMEPKHGKGQVSAYFQSRNRIINVRRHANRWQKLFYFGFFLWIAEAWRLLKNFVRSQTSTARFRIHGILDGLRYSGQPPSQNLLRMLRLH